MNKFQGGNNAINELFYKKVFDYVSDEDRVLNLGCGSQFIFERSLMSQKKAHITAIDFIAPKVIPSVVEKFIKSSVEEKFQLPSAFDVVTFFELIEHIDKTDILIQNCFNNLKKGGYLIFSFPNLASIYARAELLLGYQPHVLEVSNENSNFGAGIFGALNSPGEESIHHIRGITSRAAKDMVEFYKFNVVRIIGHDHHGRFRLLFKFFPGLAPLNIFVCQKS